MYSITCPAGIRLACTCRTHVGIRSSKGAMNAAKTQLCNFSCLINMTTTFTWLWEALVWHEWRNYETTGETSSQVSVKHCSIGMLQPFDWWHFCLCHDILQDIHSVWCWCKGQQHFITRIPLPAIVHTMLEYTVTANNVHGGCTQPNSRTRIDNLAKQIYFRTVSIWRSEALGGFASLW